MNWLYVLYYILFINVVLNIVVWLVNLGRVIEGEYIERRYDIGDVIAQIFVWFAWLVFFIMIWGEV